MVGAIVENVAYRIPLLEGIDHHEIRWNSHLVFHPYDQIQKGHRIEEP